MAVGKRLPFSRTRNTRRHCGRTESFADDLRTSRSVVPGRAASSLRSIETLLLTGGFVYAKIGNVPRQERSRWSDCSRRRRRSYGNSVDRSLLLLGVSRADRDIGRDDDGLVVTYAVYGLCRFGKSMF